MPGDDSKPDVASGFQHLRRFLVREGEYGTIRQRPEARRRQRSVAQLFTKAGHLNAAMVWRTILIAISARGNGNKHVRVPAQTGGFGKGPRGYHPQVAAAILLLATADANQRLRRSKLCMLLRQKDRH